jgi:hypothetical protein
MLSVRFLANKMIGGGVFYRKKMEGDLFCEKFTTGFKDAKYLPNYKSGGIQPAS